MLDVEVVSRQGALSEDDWWDLRMSVGAAIDAAAGRSAAYWPDSPLSPET